VREFASFCDEFRAAIEARCATRATQTNEVGRCAALHSVLAWLRATGLTDVGLLDLGCSAGLNLFVDAYAYDFSGHRAGRPGAVPELRCELRGSVPPLVAPQVTHRVGLDLSPVDLGDDDAVAWLLACLWPDDLERFERLEAAMEVASSRASEYTLVRGDMVEDLARAAAIASDASHLVVLNTWSAAYLPRDRRGALADEIASLAASRPLTWVVMEHPVISRDLGLIDPHAAVRDGVSTVCVADYRDGTVQRATLAETHHHGQWLDWFEPQGVS
jgi:hypothetical protein